MIRIGLTENQKQKVIIEQVKEHNIKSVIVFSPQKFFMKLPDLGDIPIRQIEYKEVIMYRTFYPLLEEIGERHLLVVNEFLRTKNRNDLTYNCLRHYLNQCGHQLICEYFPFIDQIEDFMILLDFDTKSKHKGFPFSLEYLKESDVLCVNHRVKLNVKKVGLPEEAEEEYKNKKLELFERIENRDPDIIPRELHIFTGKWKKPYINPDQLYVARNSRFNLSNVVPYTKVQPKSNYTLLDWQHKRLPMNDFFKITEQHNITYMSTGLSIDQVYIKGFKKWNKRLEEFYAQTGVYPSDG